MNSYLKFSRKSSPVVLDLLLTKSSQVPFIVRVKRLALTRQLESKVLKLETKLPGSGISKKRDDFYLTRSDEQELATEMLLLRHQFTESLFSSKKFQQATLTIIQNIYLFQNRRIFFGTTSSTPLAMERQEALELFSVIPSRTSIPLGKTLQHLILARVWNRIITRMTDVDMATPQFRKLHSIVEKMNTVRNIYMLLTTGLVKKLTSRINDIYRESLTPEDSAQIGSLGVARASYRYHQSTGVRFSTFAANWVFKEIQRQSLQGRLIRLSTNSVEQYCRAIKSNNSDELQKYKGRLSQSKTKITALYQADSTGVQRDIAGEDHSLEQKMESQEQRMILLQAIDDQLSPKAADIIKRRYGLPPYEGQEQSVISISQDYGVTRGSIYQMEQNCLKKLKRHLIEDTPHYPL